jgi:mycothiol system anti-sigma-R factor
MTRIDRLTCEETFRRLDDYLDRELSADEMVLVEQHLRTCAACAGEYAFEAGVLRTIRSKLHRLHAPPALRDRISRLIRAHQDGAASRSGP